jgi:hypothetical protein
MLHMNVEALTSMLSNRTGMQQSMASTVMNIVLNYAVQHFMQKGLLGNLLGGAELGGDVTRASPTTTPSPTSSSSLQSALSQLMTSSANDPHHPLVQEVKNKSGLNDDNQVRQYTQQAIGVLQDNANKDSQGFGSLISSFTGGGTGGIGDLVGGPFGK